MFVCCASNPAVAAIPKAANKNNLLKSIFFLFKKLNDKILKRRLLFEKTNENGKYFMELWIFYLLLVLNLIAFTAFCF